MVVAGEPKAATATLLCVGYGRGSLLESRKRKQEQQSPARVGCSCWRQLGKAAVEVAMVVIGTFLVLA
ncbi:hypothetical protein BHE74_00055035 [Ensete ventricosum]|nr:hypothetical protein BHE74_00055035 [Ensete ventricosum]